MKGKISFYSPISKRVEFFELDSKCVQHLEDGHMKTVELTPLQREKITKAYGDFVRRIDEILNNIASTAS